MGRLPGQRQVSRGGRIDGYNGNASVSKEYHIDNGTRDGAGFLDEQWLDTTWISHGALDLQGKSTLFEEEVVQADGDSAGASFRAYGISGEESRSQPYSGGAEAAITNTNYWDENRYCNNSSNLVKAYHSGEIAGKRIGLDEWARRADGDLANTHARITNGFTLFNASATTKFEQDISFEPGVVDIEVRDITFSLSK